MNSTQRQAQAAEAAAKCEALRSEMSAVKVGSRKWAALEGDLNFWQGKAAMYATEQGWAK